VNGDKVVDVADITAVISVIENPSHSNSINADVNGDGVVNVADIVAIINEIAVKAS
jgi:hypothetical protein